MPEFLKSIWGDPVWSKVISVGIIALLGTAGTWIFNDQKTKWPIIGMIVCGVGFISCFVWYWNASDNSVPSPARRSHPAATAVGPPAQQPSRKYSKADADRMLTALFELYDTINSNVDAIGRVNGFWPSPGQLMQGKSVKEKIEITTRTRDRVHIIAKDIYNTILPKYRYYADDLRPLIQGDVVISQANGALNDFIDTANDITDVSNDRAIKRILEPKQAELDRVLADFVGWARDSKARIAAKRSEIESQGQ